MALFDIRPKERREDFYDREEELRSLMEGIELGEGLIIVYGIRRVGKSSLARVSLGELGLPYVLVDVREVYYSENTISQPVLVRHILDGFRQRVRWYKRVGLDLREALKRIKKLKISDYSVELEPGARVGLTSILRGIDEWCGSHGLRFVVVFDEAQYLRYSNIRYDGVIAWAFDNLRNVTFVLTGSEVGVLRDFLRLNDPEAPLFGRYAREVVLERFSEERSRDFLRRGFAEYGADVSASEIDEAVSNLDGVVGWLTLYGYYRVSEKLAHREALRRVFEKGSRLVLSEIEHVIAPSRKRYVAILKAVAAGMGRWSDIKAYTEARAGHVTDKRFTELIKKLVKYGYLVKRDGVYVIPDPVVRWVVLNILRS